MRALAFLCCMIILLPLKIAAHGNHTTTFPVGWSHYSQQNLANQRFRKEQIALFKIQTGMYFMGVGCAHSVCGQNIKCIQWTVAGLFIWFSGLLDWPN